MLFLGEKSLYIHGTFFFGNELTYMKFGGDMMCFLGFGILLSTLLFTKLSFQMSRKTQCLYLLASLTRVVSQMLMPRVFLDYELLYPVTFSSMCLLLIVLANLHQKYEEHDDSFRWTSLLAATIILALIFNYGHLDISPRVVCWAWAHYLDAVAILPQLVWLASSATSSANNKILHLYVNIQTVSRILNILHWTYMYFDQDAYDHLALVSDFFHLTCHMLFLGFMILKRRQCCKVNRYSQTSY